jgi:hypothetical protein
MGAQFSVFAAACIYQFAMKVNNVAVSGPFVQIIDILGDYSNSIVLFQRSNEQMGIVGLYLSELSSSLVVKIQYQFGIPLKSLWAGDVFNAVTFPKTSGIPEGFNTAFCTDAGT